MGLTQWCVQNLGLLARSAHTGVTVMWTGRDTHVVYKGIPESQWPAMVIDHPFPTFPTQPGENELHSADAVQKDLQFHSIPIPSVPLAPAEEECDALSQVDQFMCCNTWHLQTKELFRRGHLWNLHQNFKSDSLVLVLNENVHTPVWYRSVSHLSPFASSLLCCLWKKNLTHS